MLYKNCLFHSGHQRKYLLNTQKPQKMILHDSTQDIILQILLSEQHRAHYKHLLI